jgi:hypothetical protein
MEQAQAEVAAGDPGRRFASEEFFFLLQRIDRLDEKFVARQPLGAAKGQDVALTLDLPKQSGPVDVPGYQIGHRAEPLVFVFHPYRLAGAGCVGWIRRLIWIPVFSSAHST